jgi:DNA-binding NarL/FixJ family response regulator
MASASDYVLKGVRGSVLIDKVRTVAAGGFLLDSSLSRRVVNGCVTNTNTTPVWKR